MPAAPVVKSAPLEPLIHSVIRAVCSAGARYDVQAKVCTRVAQPTDAPGAGTYTTTQSVTLANTYTGSTLFTCYTTDGSAPWFNGASCGNGTHYTGAFNITTTSTLKAISCATNYSCSTLDSALYTINSISRVQATSNATSSGASSVSVTISSTGAGNLLVVSCGADNRPVTSCAISDNAGGGSQTYTSAVTLAPGAFIGINYKASTASGVTTVTCTPNTFATVWCTVEEYTGVSILDKTATHDNGFNNANPQSSGTTATTTAANEVSVCIFSQYLGLGATATLSTPGSYSLNTTNQWAGAGGAEYLSAYQVLAATGTQACTSNLTTAGSGWDVLSAIATFK